MQLRLRTGAVVAALVFVNCSRGRDGAPGGDGPGTPIADLAASPSAPSDLALSPPPWGSDLALADLAGAPPRDLAGAPAPDLAMGPMGASFQNDVLPILSSRGCFSHHMTAAWNGVEGLTSNAAIIAYLTSTASSQCGADKFVRPSDATHSYVYQKVSGQFFSPCATSDPMPLGSGPLPTAESDTIKSWINAGAPNN